MYRCCPPVGVPRFFNLGTSLESSKLFFFFVPPPEWSRSPRRWITRGRLASPVRRIRPSNNGRHHHPKYKGACEKFLLLGRHHVPHIPGRLGGPMYGHIAQRRVSRVSQTGQEVTHGVHGPWGVNHMEGKL